tara:strand:- start:2120 stop:3847 length:1728 start_codon:yes stop_codon:yes gene_type:complete
MLNNYNYRPTSVFIYFCLFVSFSCTGLKGYFNTFYNAEQYFDKAEKIRIQNRGDKIPKTAFDHYEKVIEKSEYVINTYPEFKFRKKAQLLIAQSHFYRSEYDEASSVLLNMSEEFGDQVTLEYSFWSAMIKWREGKVQAAINLLSSLNNAKINNNEKAKIYMAIAEIYFDEKMESESMDYLEKAAKIIKDPVEKGQIYYRIADLSFENKVYDRALASYQQVIKNSQSKKQVQEANLRSVQIYRLNDDLDKATNSIKGMLLDDVFKPIFGSLELELVKLYDQQEMFTEAKNRLESILQDYPKTKTSAEAYYMLGNYAISQEWDLLEASKHFGMVSKEFSKSMLVKPALLRVKEINSYDNLILQYDSYIERLSVVDTLGMPSLTIKDNNDFATVIYGLAELESFHFSRIDSGILYLNQLIELTPNSPLYPKALYAKAIILDEQGDYIESKALKTQIVTNYSQTDFALALINADSTFSKGESSSDLKLIQAENNWGKDPIIAMDNYREIVNSDTVSETSARAAYFLAYQYDRLWVKPDSALKYYGWIMKYHSSSDQALPSSKRITFLNQVLSDTSSAQ